MMVSSLLAKVTLLGSLAISVGGVVPTSKAGNAAMMFHVHSNPQVSADVESSSAGHPTGNETKRAHTRAMDCTATTRKTSTSEAKTMKNSIANKNTWWAVSYLGVRMASPTES